jgi:hypothetical protein
LDSVVRFGVDKSRICRAQTASWLQAANLRSLHVYLHVLAHLRLSQFLPAPPSLFTITRHVTDIKLKICGSPEKMA